MDFKLNDARAALEIQIRHYKAHVKKQATQIVALEGKVVDLEAEIAYLQDALAQERQRQPTVSLVTTSQPPGELQAASSGSNEPPHGALKQRDSPFKPPPTAYRARPYTPALSHTGSADDPFVLDDEDDVITAPPVASSSSAAHEPVSSQKRKARLSPAPLPDSLSSLSVWPPVESPRKKVKVWVQIPKAVKRVSDVARVSVAPTQSETGEQSGGSAVAPPDSWERSMSPMSDLTTTPGSPAPVEVSLDDERAPSYAEDESAPPPRSFSRELSYVDVSFSTAHSTTGNTSHAEQSAQNRAEEHQPPVQAPVSTTLNLVRNPSATNPPDLSSSGSSSTVLAQAKQSRRQMVLSGTRNKQLSTQVMHSRGLPRVAPATSSSGIPNIGARRSALAAFPMPLVSPALLKLRVSRKELLHGRMHIPFMPLCATVTMKVTGNTRHFLFPTIDQNPFLPQAPGKPGLLYRANDAKKWRDGVQAVFVQRRSAVYEYVGEYELTRAPSLSVVEYMTWPSKAKTEWVDAICDKAKFMDIWARVTLRDRFGREPTLQEVRRAIIARKEQKKADAAARIPATRNAADVEKIRKAYEDGDEAMGVWNMVCVGFDEQLLVTIQEDKTKMAG